jgi:hypothetical protein
VDAAASLGGAVDPVADLAAALAVVAGEAPAGRVVPAAVAVPADPVAGATADPAASGANLDAIASPPTSWRT